MSGSVEMPSPAAQAMPSAQLQRQPTGKRRTLGDWDLLKTIGAGSMGKVKLARHRLTGEVAAVKIVPRYVPEGQLHLHNSKYLHIARPSTDTETDKSADEAKEIRTIREAAIASLLNHRFVCAVREVLVMTHHYYIVFEYVNGGQMLDYIISHGRLKEKQARKFARQIASALDYCHHNSVVHRDLKIENILISKSGDIKIIDFGLSNLYSPRALLKTFCGSLYFAAPELLNAKQYVGPEVDVWSFGIVLYVLACGKVPFDDQSMPALHAKIKRGYVEYPAWLSTECKSLLARMLVVDPKARATMAEIINHPWMVKGYEGPQDSYLPARRPLTLPLDRAIIKNMHGFEFGSDERIEADLTAIIDSPEYQSACQAWYKHEGMPFDSTPKKKAFAFDFYKRRTSTSQETLIEKLDPTNAYHPLISIYYLVSERQERSRRRPTLTEAAPEMEMPVIPVPEIAHTHAQPSRTLFPRSRSVNHGHSGYTPDLPEPAVPEQTPPARISLGGIFRRLSTRKPRVRPSPSVASASSEDQFTATPYDDHPEPVPELHAPEAKKQGLIRFERLFSRASNLGRSTSISEGTYNRRMSRP